MTELTASKLDVFHTVATLFMSICAALSCAGRIGMHGAAPPGWLMGLYSGHIFTALLYFGTSVWLGMHGSLMAQASMTRMLTQKVRLPIPSLSQIDGARTFGSTFELQKGRDLFRVPFMRHPHDKPEPAEASSGDSDGGTKDKGVTKAKKKQYKAKRFGDEPKKPYGDWGFAKGAFKNEFGSSARDTVPSWIRDEQVVDKGQGCVGGDASVAAELHEAHQAPAHFQAYHEAQQDWWPYDVNARIALLAGVMQVIYAVMYYIIGTVTAELRAFWIAWSAPMLFCAVQAMILRMDILHTRNKGSRCLPNAEWAGHIAPYFAVAAETLEIRLWYSPATVVITWILVILCYTGHLIAALRLYDLARPDSPQDKEREDEAGKSWWPQSWKVPLAFSESLWILAPPKKLERGQHDMITEMKILEATGAGVKSKLRNRSKKGGKRRVMSKFEDMEAADMGQMELEILNLQYSLERRFRSLDERPNLWQKKNLKGQLEASNTRFLLTKEQVRLLGTQGAGSVSKAGYSSASSSEGEEGEDPTRRNLNSANQVLRELRAVDSELCDIEDACNAPAAGGDALVAVSGDSPLVPHRLPASAEIPWRFLRLVILTTAFCWVFMIIASFIEILLGPEVLIKWPGEPPWIRDVRNREVGPDYSGFDNYAHKSSEQLPADYRLFWIDANDPGDVPGQWPAKGEVEEHHGGGEHGEEDGHGSSDTHATTDEGHGGGGEHGRLLVAATDVTGQNQASEAIHDLIENLPSIQWLATALGHEDGFAGMGLPSKAYDARLSIPTRPEPAPKVAFMAPALRTAPVNWPNLFEPRHLVCGTSSVDTVFVALTSRGFGAHINLEGDGTTQIAQATTFALEGVGEFGPIIGAAWEGAGLQIVSKTGQLGRCFAQTSDAHVWSCHTVAGASLPVPHGTELLAAAVTDQFAALAYIDSPGQVALFANRSDATGWKPAGEVHIPRPSIGGSALVNMAFAGSELIITAENGEVLTRQLGESSSIVHKSPASMATLEWRAACRLPGGNLTRLAVRQSGTPGRSIKRSPELILSA